MKKMMTIMASLATTLFAFGAVGDVSAPPAGFESYNSGDGFVPSVIEGKSTYWYASASITNDTNIITNYADSGTSVPLLPTNVVRPDGMKENDAYPSNSKFLSLETSTPLFRSVQANNQDGTFTGSTIGDGIYLDTLVKFTASEEEFKDGALEANVDKIAIEYVDQTTDESIDNPIKAFVIRAGYIGSNSLFQTNYYAYLPDDKTLQNFDVNAWHRLTVRTIANIGGNNVGFIVYLDQKPLAYDGDCGDNFSPSTDAQNYYDNEIHAVYPSAVEANITGGDKIAAVAFSGTGAIDDVVFTTETPEFITASESVVVPFVADAGVTAISVLPDGAAEAILVDMTADTLVAVLPAQTTNFTVNVTVDGDNGYTFGSITVGETDYDTNPASVTGYNGDAITVTTVRNNFNLVDGNGDPISGTYQTLTDALGATGVARIQLAHDYDVTPAEIAGASAEIYAINDSIVLDLNGQKLDGGDGNGFELFYVYNSLKVIDSVGGGKIVYGGTVFGSEGTLLVGDVDGDNGATIDGVLLNAGAPGYIIRANVLANGNTDTGTDTFLWAAFLGDGESVESAATLTGNYWVVTPQGAIGTYTVTVTPTANATYAAAYKVGGETITPANDVLTVTVGQTIVITATPAANYEYAEAPTGWTAGQDGEITIEVSAAGTVAIPAPTAVSSSDLDPESNTPVEIEAESEAAATNAVQLVTPSGVDPAAYKDLFDFTVTEVVAGAKYNVAIAGIKESVEVAVEESAMDVLDGKLGAKVQVPAGLNYKITTYETLGGSAVNTTSGQSDGTGVSVSKPGDTQGFIKIEMATVPFN